MKLHQHICSWIWIPIFFIESCIGKIYNKQNTKLYNLLRINVKKKKKLSTHKHFAWSWFSKGNCTFCHTRIEILNLFSMSFFYYSFIKFVVLNTIIISISFIHFPYVSFVFLLSFTWFALTLTTRPLLVDCLELFVYFWSAADWCKLI